MKKQMLAAALIAALPLAALPQGTGAGAGPGPGSRAPRRDPERMEKRMRLVRTIGLAEALDLDTEQALKLRETIARFDERRLAAHTQMRDARGVLRRAAQGEKVAAADVDQAIQKLLDARTQLQAADRDIVAAVTKDLTPEKKARAVLFLARFHRRFGGPGMHGRMGPGMGKHHGRGMRGGMGMGPGNGPGMRGMGPPSDGDWDDEE